MKKHSNSDSPEFKRGLTEEEINSPDFDPDDFAPAPEVAKEVIRNDKAHNRFSAMAFAVVVAVFALIVGLLAWGATQAVSAYNEGYYERNVLSVFPNCDRVEKYNINNEEYEVFAVFFKDRMAGYCVLAKADGFGGEIEYLVGFNSQNVITNIKVLSHNESHGLGSKIAGEGFLDQFKGLLTGNSTAKYDLIAGATTSSKALGEGIKSILALKLSSDSIANDFGYETITEEEIEEEVKKEDPDKDEDKGDSEETTGNANGGIGNHQGGSNSNNGDGDVDLGGRDETTDYETETTGSDEDTTAPDDETTDADTTVADTTAPVDTTVSDTTKAPDTTVADTTVADTTVADTTVPTDTTTADTTVADTTDDAPVQSPDTTGEADNVAVDPIDEEDD